MKSNNCLNMQFDLLEGMFFDKKEDNNEYIFCCSETMDDEFWNIVYIKNKLSASLLQEIEDKFKKINRRPSIYISEDDKDYEFNKEVLKNNNYNINNSDVYMKLVKQNKNDININIKVVENEDEYSDFMKVLSSAYNDSIENPEENVYADAVTECYYKAVKNTINTNHYHIIAYADNIPVSVATLNYVNGVGGINNVGTAQGYWNKGYGKQVLTYLINLFETLGGGTLTLSTEHNSKNQKFYEKLGFQEQYVIEQYLKNK